MFVRYLSYCLKLRVDYLRRNFNVYCVCPGHAYGARVTGLLGVHKCPSVAISISSCSLFGQPQIG
jgi:hypothetical protein